MARPPFWKKLLNEMSLATLGVAPLFTTATPSPPLKAMMLSLTKLLLLWISTPWPPLPAPAAVPAALVPM
jgi:hypothetical protein